MSKKRITDALEILDRRDFQTDERQAELEGGAGKRRYRPAHLRAADERRMAGTSRTISSRFFFARLP